MDFGLTFEKLLLIGVLAAVIIGPERLPKAAETFAGFVRRAGEYLRDTKSKMRDEIGPEIDDVDWRKLDPRQYDPRRIIRDALMDDAPSATTAASSAVTASAATPVLDPPRSPLVRPEFTSATPPPFDLEAT
ncbi:Sec-independent protein translocase TatB [Microbacterium murale]|uniref:Sec-independent protein translocase protein TatB n=1 Tax=Microbacterium murale TaxID=1081040 RepID=A0ABU0PCA6_9MICO|nr:Sec-independent protein translocase TatB [Microbacterium murale]MDQ0644975.1 sec-independent protein translocase protein TatB [Microbacterium murale]